MTLAAVMIEPAAAHEMLTRFRAATGLTGELKGSRINMEERAFALDLFVKANARATIGIAISALKPAAGADRGDHDRKTYAALLEDVIGALLIEAQGCGGVIIDDGRYDVATLAPIRTEIAALVGPCSQARFELSHRSAGLQIADVIANTFFNRALVSPRQNDLASMVQPMLDNGQMVMRILPSV